VWEQAYDAEEYIRVLSSYSGHRSLVLQCYLYIGYEATASSPELEHFHYALPETFFAPLAVATVYRSPRPELLFR